MMEREERGKRKERCSRGSAGHQVFVCAIVQGEGGSAAHWEVPERGRPAVAHFWDMG